MSELKKILTQWRTSPEMAETISTWHVIPPQNALQAHFPAELHPKLRRALNNTGIDALYAHQLVAFNHLNDGRNIVVATGTASGKTLCYNLAVIDHLLKNPQSTALYLFPTKALAQDQLQTLNRLLESAGIKDEIKPAIYDGDTPSQHRSAIRKSSRLVITNPDMLHQGILPHHTLWNHLLAGLTFVTVDEIHIYRGVFGSHVANVIRRLKRICAFYGSYPSFAMTSATIGNPLELAENLTENQVELVDQDGSPHGEQNFIIYNPPLVDEALGLRKSALQMSVNLSKDLLAKNIQTLVFARTRRTVEMVLTYLLEQVPYQNRELIRGYRSGYLRGNRREIEEGFKSGKLRVIVATSALELGIDIGDLETVLILGYPGSIAMTLQRAGRAGRKLQTAIAMLIATPDAMDQYLCNHPELLLEGSPENALIDANNLSILMQHLRCAAFELPFAPGDRFGRLPDDLLKAFLEVLTRHEELVEKDGRYYWMADQYPAAGISLRSSSPNVISLLVQEEGQEKQIGTLDAASAPWLIHPEAIYLHEAVQYLVKSLDLENGLCQLEPAQTDYYTMPQLETTIEKYTPVNSVAQFAYQAAYGELTLVMEINQYRKLRWLTNETIGTGVVDLPPRRLETFGFWLALSEDLINRLRDSGDWTADANQYGAVWPKLRQNILLRDGNRCRGCGIEMEPSRLHIHHIKPFRSFADPALANHASNLVTLCPACHRQAESNVRIRSGIAGAVNAMRNLAPLFILCDREDIGMLFELKSVLADGGPAILVYDNIPGGLGLSRKLFDLRQAWLTRSLEMISECGCANGCPACVGPVGEDGYGGKNEAIALLKEMVAHGF